MKDKILEFLKTTIEGIVIEDQTLDDAYRKEKGDVDFDYPNSFYIFWDNEDEVWIGVSELMDYKFSDFSEDIQSLIIRLIEDDKYRLA